MRRMMVRTPTFVWMMRVAVALLLLAPSWAAVAVAQETAMDPAMMEAWQRSMAPGEPHEKLAQSAGRWKAHVKMWMEPGGEAQLSEGVFERSMILGGRVLSEGYESEFMGQSFEGHGLTGYDNITGKYWGIWSDNMSTGPMIQWGQWDDTVGGVVYEGEFSDAMTGGRIAVRTVVKHLEDGSEMMEMFHEVAGQEMKVMEIHSVKQ